MWTNDNLDLIYEYDPYTSPNGTKYPGNFPKEEIAGLYPVVDEPCTPTFNCYISDYTIVQENGVYKRRAILSERSHADMLNLQQQEACNRLYETDMVAIRCMKAGVPFPEEWREYVKLLRHAMNTDALVVISSRPDYPEGT